MTEALPRRPQKNLWIEFRAVLRGMSYAVDLGGVGAGDALRFLVEERGPHGRGANVDGEHDRFG